MKHPKQSRAPLAVAIAGLLAGTTYTTTLFAQEAPEDEALNIEEVVVTGSLRSLPGEDVQIFGFGKSLLETPRSASTISFEQMDRFNITDIDELVAFAPGTFTQSFFGVAGSLDVRGTPGETYFRGVRRIDNPGNYPTPIGASDRIDIVRGPASPIYGPAKIGGYINFNPKSARAGTGAFLEEHTGAVSYETGSWDRNVVTAEVGGPMADNMGYYLYAEVEDSDSFYDNTATEQTILQASFDVELSDKLLMQFGGMYHDYEGNQVAGWNRLTQDLIDNGNYQAGTARPLDTDGDGEISHFEYFDGGVTNFFGSPTQVTNEFLQANPNYHLDNPSIVKLDESNVLVAEDDTLENEVTTLYLDFIYTADSGLEIKNQLFYEAYENLNENAYGFSQFHDTYVVEDKLVFAYQIQGDGLTSSLQFSPSIRYTDFKHGDDYINEYFDRRDLTGPSTALDRRVLSTRIDNLYTEYYVGDYTMYGLAFLGDFTWDSGLAITLGARSDTIDMTSSSPNDKLLFGDSLGSASDTEDLFSWNVSVNYSTPMGLVPYVTVSEQATIIAGQGAELQVGNILNGNITDTSELFEVGLKGSFLDDSLYFAVSVYEQERTDFSAQAVVTNSTDKTEGIEAELRWVVNEKLIVTAGYTNVEVRNLDTTENGGRFSFYGAEDIPGVDTSLLFGGLTAGFVPTEGTNATPQKAGIPENIYTLTGTYAFDMGLALTGSVISVDETVSGHSRAVNLPSYTLLNLGVSYETDNWTFQLNGKNLTDERYFRANFPNLFGSQIVLPELPANYQAKVVYKF